jgi:hypothetical protein
VPDHFKFIQLINKFSATRWFVAVLKESAAELDLQLNPVHTFTFFEVIPGTKHFKMVGVVIDDCTGAGLVAWIMFGFSSGSNDSNQTRYPALSTKNFCKVSHESRYRLQQQLC